jgi:hypothetical protein
MNYTSYKPSWLTHDGPKRIQTCRRKEPCSVRFIISCTLFRIIRAKHARLVHNKSTSEWRSVMIKLRWCWTRMRHHFSNCKERSTGEERQAYVTSDWRLRKTAKKLKAYLCLPAETSTGHLQIWSTGATHYINIQLFNFLYSKLPSTASHKFRRINILH